ncbi:sporulation protein [Streptomyces sp. WMMC940]|uniref:sporulation protein n=1 Tax=Streptomyces sp. WMMC940 TaxID=3015153 RepID=UPI0022B6C5A3|nr:sporulation protein [Streptomyces sp. WMMC940]MCZ7457195.1 sporulation protein [Streptomyces sp. WMMC940]
MVFKRLLGSVGVGGPAVDTVLAPGAVPPGGTLTGEVRLEGGDTAFEIEHITLEFVARVEAESREAGEGEREAEVAFERFTVGGGFRLDPGVRHVVPFAVTVPWETPVTELHGQALGVVLGVRTELGVAGARDRGDLDLLAVRPLPVQEAVLEAFGQLGFGFRSADIEYGRIGGTGQQLPFHQEIELTPPPHDAHAVDEVEVTFLAGPGRVEVVLEADRRGGLSADGHEAPARFDVAHDEAGDTDWKTRVRAWLHYLLEHRSGPAGHGPHGGNAAHGLVHGGGHEDHHHAGHHGHHRGGHHGPGTGAAVAVGAAGLAVGAGIVGAEVVDEIGDAFEDEGPDGSDAEGEGEEG